MQNDESRGSEGLGVGEKAIASSTLMLDKQSASIKLCTKPDRGGLHERR